jgi:hypothetical protein
VLNIHKFSQATNAIKIFSIEPFNCSEWLHFNEYEDHGETLQLSLVQYDAFETKNVNPLPMLKMLLIDPHEAL